MGTPTPTPSTTTLRLVDPLPSEQSHHPADSDELAEIDVILGAVAQRDRQSAEDAAHVVEVERDFLAGFEAACTESVKPAMKAVLERLERNGGSGLIEEHRGVGTRVSTPRLTLWMSLEGEIAGTPRQDRHPYLQLDADIAEESIQVSEGDMWRGTGGGRSGRVQPWKLTDISYERIIRELLSIIRRSAPHVGTEEGSRGQLSGG